MTTATATPRQRTASPVLGGEAKSITLTLPRIGRKVFKIIGMVLVGMILFGLGAMTGQQTQTPDANTVSVLRYAAAHSPEPCYAVWGVSDTQWTVKCGTLR